MFQIKAEDLRKSLSKLSNDDYVIIKSNQIILPTEPCDNFKAVPFKDMAKAVQKFAELAAKASETETKKEEQKENIFEGLF